MRTATTTSALIAIFVIGVPIIASAQSDEADRVKEAGVILSEIMAAPNKAIPASVLEKAEAIAVFPSTIKGPSSSARSAARGSSACAIERRAHGRRPRS